MEATNLQLILTTQASVEGGLRAHAKCAVQSGLISYLWQARARPLLRDVVWVSTGGADMVLSWYCLLQEQRIEH